VHRLAVVGDRSSAAMRTSLAALLFLAAVTPAAAADRVIVAPPLMNVVNNAHRLHDVCPSDGDFDACTRFVAFRLTASCSPRREGEWAIEASAAFRPWIFAWNLASIPHEQLHIADIRESAERYVDALMQKSFTSQSACEAAALSASSSFEEKMREFARRSNERRHRAILRASR
jgi:hypothetical protein